MRPRGFALLAELQRDLDGAWLAEHGDEVDTHLRSPFAQVLEEATKHLAAAGEDLGGGRDTMFRAWRDRRFARDGAAVVPWVEGVIAPGRRKIGSRGSIHVRLDGRGGFVAAGSFLVGPAGRLALRETIVARRERFLGIAAALASEGAALVAERSLQRPPRGFEAERGTALEPYLALVDPVARWSLSKKAWLNGTIAVRIAEFARVTRALRLFQREALEGVNPTPARPPRSPRRT